MPGGCPKFTLNVQEHQIGSHNAKQMERVPANTTSAGKWLSEFERRGIILFDKTVMVFYGFFLRLASATG